MVGFVVKPSAILCMQNFAWLNEVRWVVIDTFLWALMQVFYQNQYSWHEIIVHVSQTLNILLRKYDAQMKEGMELKKIGVGMTWSYGMKLI